MSEQSDGSVKHRGTFISLYQYKLFCAGTLYPGAAGVAKLSSVQRLGTQGSLDPSSSDKKGSQLHRNSKDMTVLILTSKSC